MSWRETSRETVRSTTYIVHRCSWCRRIAVTTDLATTISPCVCLGGKPTVKDASRGRDPNAGWP